jgi:hypothetical protein
VLVRAARILATEADYGIGNGFSCRSAHSAGGGEARVGVDRERAILLDPDKYEYAIPLGARLRAGPNDRYLARIDTTAVGRSATVANRPVPAFRSSQNRTVALIGHDATLAAARTGPSCTPDKRVDRARSDAGNDHD